jgi:hypothetical protein
MKSIEGHRCPCCGGPLTYEAFQHTTRDGRTIVSVPSPKGLALCVKCVALALCVATVARHGDVGEKPHSHRFPGHEERMRAHEDRIRGLGLCNDVDEPDDELVEAVA